MEGTELFGLEYVFGDADVDIYSTDSFPREFVIETAERDTLLDTDESVGETAVFYWPKLGTFQVRDGSEIEVQLDERADPVDVRNPLLGICLGALLQQRGYAVFHGSVVEVESDAIAFVGNKGAGKSTSAAALLARGHSLLSDDIVAVSFDGTTPRVTPGFPMFKFDTDGFGDATLPAEPAPTPDTGHGKRYYELDGEFDWEPRPLARVCLLEPNAGGSRVETLTGHEAVMALVEHSWPARLRNAPYVDRERSAIEGPDIDRYARLVENSRVQRLPLEHDHETLDELGRELESILGAEAE